MIGECYCCPGERSRNDARCMKFRREVLGVKRRYNGAAGRYPVDQKFPCELCGRVEEHRHEKEQIVNA